MKSKTLLGILVAILIATWLLIVGESATAEILQIDSKLVKDPLIVSGKSGGTVTSNCGNIPATPHQVLKLKQSLPYLRLTVESEGKPTLLIDGPGGKFCVLPDAYSGNKPTMSGFFPKGDYNLSVGQLIKANHNYNLSISQQKE